jgi:hypothetical protein
VCQREIKRDGERGGGKEIVRKKERKKERLYEKE